MTKQEKGFLYFFLPLFAIKLLDFTAGSFILKAVAVACFIAFVTHFINESYKAAHFKLFSVLLVYTAVLVVTCGKQGAFFSVIALAAMKGVDMNRKVYGILLKVGIVFLLIACYIGSNSAVTDRFMGEEWVTVVKRSNILYVAYMAVACLYIMKNRAVFSRKHFVVLAVTGYLMYLYVGSRTGGISMMILLLLLVILRNKTIRRHIFVRWFCILSPLICMVVSVVLALNYSSSDDMFFLNMLTQGRLEQGYIFLHKYDVTIFGQPIVENFGVSYGNYLCLDNAYLDMILCEGLIFTVLWIVSTIWVISYMYRRGRYLEVAIIVAYALYGLCETFLQNCFLNISLLLYGEALYSLPAFYTKPQMIVTDNKSRMLQKVNSGGVNPVSRSDNYSLMAA